MTLHKKIALGALWSLVEKVGNQGVSFIAFLFVARLVGPKEYGLANICLVYFYFANIIILGLADGIISLQIRNERQLSTLFWCVMGVGCGLMLVCIVFAGTLADFMGEPRLRPLLQWFSLISICLAASVVPNKMLTAEMRFRVLAISDYFCFPFERFGWNSSRVCGIRGIRDRSAAN